MCHKVSMHKHHVGRDVERSLLPTSDLPEDGGAQKLLQTPERPHGLYVPFRGTGVVVEEIEGGGELLLEVLRPGVFARAEAEAKIPTTGLAFPLPVIDALLAPAAALIRFPLVGTVGVVWDVTILAVALAPTVALSLGEAPTPVLVLATLNAPAVSLGQLFQFGPPLFLQLGGSTLDLADHIPRVAGSPRGFSPLLVLGGSKSTPADVEPFGHLSV